MKAAQTAFKSWSKTTYEQRSQLLYKLADAVEADLPRLAMIDASISDEPCSRRPWIIASPSDSTASSRPPSSVLKISASRSRVAISLRGVSRSAVCGQIIPWNVPAIMAAFKLAPALACRPYRRPEAGRERVALDAGALQAHAKIFPPVVVNVVPGVGEEATGAALTAHRGVAKLAFTGSSEVGRIVSTAAHSGWCRCRSNLAAKAPTSVSRRREPRRRRGQRGVRWDCYCGTASPVLPARACSSTTTSTMRSWTS